MKQSQSPASSSLWLRLGVPASALALADRVEMLALLPLAGKPVQSRLTAPVVSFSFDDAPQSAVHEGARILEARGLRGTFYLNGAHDGGTFEGRLQYQGADVVRLHAAGHEIACHSWSHARFRRIGIEAMDSEIAANLAWARSLLGEDFQFDSFAYPYGAYDLQSRAWIGRRFTTARGVYRGVNAGTMDFANLRTIPLEARRMAGTELAACLDEAREKNGWIIFFTHDVQPDCTAYGSPPEWLAQAVDATRAAGIDILTVAEAAGRVMGEASPR